MTEPRCPHGSYLWEHCYLCEDEIPPCKPNAANVTEQRSLSGTTTPTAEST